MSFRKFLGRFLPDEEIQYIRSILELFGNVAECIVFFSIGMSIVSVADESKNYNPAFIALSFLLCLLGRAAFMYPLSFLLNFLRRDKHTLLDYNSQHMIMFAGLRGPISYGSSMLFPNVFGNRDMIINTTKVIMLLTIYIKGGLTAEALKFFGIKQEVEVIEDLEAPANASSLHKPTEMNEQRVQSSLIIGYSEKLENYCISPLFNKMAGKLRSDHEGNSSVMMTSLMRRRPGISQYAVLSEASVDDSQHKELETY